VPLSGILEYLIKPVVPEALFSVVRQVDKGEGMTILLVDDDPDAVRLLEGMLAASGHGYTVLHAYGGLEGLALMQHNVPDLAIVDLVMADMNGDEMITRMRAEEALREVPVVILSARDALEDGFTIGTPLSVHCKAPLEATRGAKCLQGMLVALTPHYLA
jgi:CheY-like chemotaxis protein